jgi:hypothetical protein
MILTDVDVRGEKPVPVPTNPTWTRRELNPELRDGRPVNGRPNHPTAL